MNALFRQNNVPQRKNNHDLPRHRSYAWVARLFVGIHLACIFLPLLVIVLWAFTSSWPWPELLPHEFSGRGLTEIFSNQQGLGLVLLQSICIALAVALIATLVATLAARAFTCHDFLGKELVRFSTVLPFLIPTTVFAMGVQLVFIRAGLANTVGGVILAHTIVALPYAVMIMTDAMIAAGTRLEQQARVAGAGPLRSLMSVQIPQLLPGILSAMSMSYIMSFSQYFLTLLIGGGAVKTFAVTMFPYLASGDRTIASAYGVVFLVVTLAVFFVFELLIKRYASYKTEYYNG